MQITKKGTACGRDNSEDDTVVGSRFSSALLRAREAQPTEARSVRVARRVCPGATARTASGKLRKVDR